MAILRKLRDLGNTVLVIEHDVDVMADADYVVDMGPAVCEGLGRIHSIKKERVTDETLSLEEGAVRFFEKQYGKYQCSILQKAFVHFSLDPDLSIPLQQFSREQKAILYEGADSSAVKALFPRTCCPLHSLLCFVRLRLMGKRCQTES